MILSMFSKVYCEIRCDIVGLKVVDCKYITHLLQLTAMFRWDVEFINVWSSQTASRKVNTMLFEIRELPCCVGLNKTGDDD